jgi:hypothetical protein
MPVKLEKMDREFMVWAYVIGHGQLLLRSSKTSVLKTRIDVLFKDVAVLHLPKHLDGLTITEEKDEKAFPAQLTSKMLRSRKVFVVRTSAFIGYVVAGAVFWHEDELEIEEPSYFGQSMGDPRCVTDTVLY